MDDNETIVVLKQMLARDDFSTLEREALEGALGALMLMVHTSESHIKQMKAKKARGS